MSTPAPLRRLSPEAFLAWEAQQLDRYELVDGIPYAMAGAGRLHEEVAGALFAILWTHLEGKPCRPFKADRKLQVDIDFFYPDIIVTCDADDRLGDGPLRSPIAIIEVLSRPTAAYDRGEKRERYTSLKSLDVYFIIDPETRQVERYERASHWSANVLPSSEPVRIPAIEFTVEQARLFAALD
jgi:Uma2 family endonuclease